LKLYWGPHTCAIGIHILLEEIGRPYETKKLDVSEGATHEAAFLVSPRRLFIATERRPDKVSRAMDLIDQSGVRPELLTLTTKVFDHV
jgi:hypothetical protein